MPSSKYYYVRWVQYLLVSIGCVALLASAQFYMYTPGASIEPFVSTLFDSFGGGYRCEPAHQGDSCYLSPYFDSTLCFNDPDNVSMTPWIDSQNIYGDPNASGTIMVQCGIGSIPNIVNDRIVFTTNGTLPDVLKPFNASEGDAMASISVPFSPSNPFPVIVARCIEPGKLPSRIAYARRIHWGSANGSYCPSHEALAAYRELPLPRCLTRLVGSLCDGQSIVVMPSTQSPPSTTSTSAPYPNNAASLCLLLHLAPLIYCLFLTIVINLK